MSDDDDVGYGKPPKHSQFKKGVSGNPKGRPPKKTPLDGTFDIETILNKPVKITKGGKTKSYTRFELRMQNLWKRAIVDKSIRAIVELMKLYEKYDLFRPPEPKPDLYPSIVVCPPEWELHEFAFMAKTYKLHGAWREENPCDSSDGNIEESAHEK